MPPPAAKKPPSRPQQIIDIYNSTSTGHQVGSGVSKPTSWHRSRCSKLQQQLRSHSHSLTRVGIIPETTVTVTTSTTVVSNSPTVKHPHAPGSPKLVEEGDPAIAELVTTQTGTSDPPQQQDSTNKATPLCTPTGFSHTSAITSTGTGTSTAPAPAPKPTQSKIFTNCTIYVNGTTAPAISDLALKRLLCTHGASITTMLARKSVTHVILGKPSSAGGAGGGLAAGKLQKELVKNGKPIKFVSVQWALDSVKAGRCLSETNYTVLKMHSQSQRSMKGFAKASTDKVTLEATNKVGNTKPYTKTPE